MLRSPIWWLWLATALVLSAGLALAWHHAFVIAMCLAGLLVLEGVERESGLINLPVQVRTFFLLTLFAVEASPMPALFLLPTIGVWVLVLFDYCIFARLLVMLPWNRTRPLSREFLRKLWLSPDRRKVAGVPTRTCLG